VGDLPVSYAAVTGGKALLQAQGWPYFLPLPWPLKIIVSIAVRF